MKKRIFGLLLAVLLLVSLLPISALAAEGTEKSALKLGHAKGSSSHVYWSIKKGDAPKYATNGEDGLVTNAGANEDNYTIKFDFSGDKPVIYLRGVDYGRYDEEKTWIRLGSEWHYSHIGSFLDINNPNDTKEDANAKWVTPDIVIEKDSQAVTLNSGFVIRGEGDCTIKSVNGAKLTMVGGGYSTNGTIQSIVNVIFDKAVLDLDIHPDNRPLIKIGSGATEANPDGIAANLTIKNSNIVAKSFGLVVDCYGDVAVTDSNIDFSTTNMTSLGLITATGNISITGGESKLVKPTNFSFGKGGLDAGKDVTIDGGTHFIQSDNGAIKAEGKITIKNATVEMVSKNFKVTNRFPILEYDCYELIAGKNEAKATPFYGTDFTGVYYAKVYAANADETQPKPTDPPATTQPATDPTTTQPAGTSTTTGTEVTDSTPAPTDPTKKSAFNPILLIPIVILVVGVIAAVVIVLAAKKKNAAPAAPANDAISEEATPEEKTEETEPKNEE